MRLDNIFFIIMAPKKFNHIFKKYPLDCFPVSVGHPEFTSKDGEWCFGHTDVFSTHEIDRSNEYFNKLFINVTKSLATATLNDKEWANIITEKITQSQIDIPYKGKLWTFNKIDNLFNIHLIQDHSIVDSSDIIKKNKWSEEDPEKMYAYVYWIPLNDGKGFKLKSSNTEKDVEMAKSEILLTTKGIFLNPKCCQSSRYIVVMKAVFEQVKQPNQEKK